MSGGIERENWLQVMPFLGMWYLFAQFSSIPSDSASMHEAINALSMQCLCHQFPPSLANAWCGELKYLSSQTVCRLNMLVYDTDRLYS